MTDQQSRIEQELAKEAGWIDPAAVVMPGEVNYNEPENPGL